MPNKKFENGLDRLDDATEHMKERNIKVKLATAGVVTAVSLGTFSIFTVPYMVYQGVQLAKLHSEHEKRTHKIK